MPESCAVCQIRREGRVTVVSEVIQRHQPVKVKVLSFNGQRISLSIKVSLTLLSLVCECMGQVIHSIYIF